MQSFGTNEYGNKDGFTIMCNRCGREAKLVPIHYYENGNYKNPSKITLEIGCICGNKFGATVDNRY